MKKEIPTQLIVGLGILLIGGLIVGGEFLLVKWYPGHKEALKKEARALSPYKNDGLGIEMQVAAGINGKVEVFSGGVRISSSRFWSVGPSITVTSQPNPDRAGEFTPVDLAKWESDGVTQELARYHFEHARINDRDAVLIWQLKAHGMTLTAHIIAPDRIVEATCEIGHTDEDIYMQACDDTVRTIKLEGPPSPPPSTSGEAETTPGKPAAKP
ncbi:MAG TPA: hypothetical protein VMO17_09055 [Terriglobia bacterium]|nr:hypothetical protein [Terriglobia bacterium]